MDMFQVSDSLFCWNTKVTIRAEGLLQDDMELFDIHDEMMMLECFPTQGSCANFLLFGSKQGVAFRNATKTLSAFFS